MSDELSLRRYLRVIMGDEPPAGLLEVRPLMIGGGGSDGRDWFPVTDDGLAAAEVAIRRMAPRRQVYVGVAPRNAREGHIGAVERVWCLWVDIDSESDVKDYLWPFRPHPSVVIRSGSGGAHAYWPLDRPLSGPLAQRANRRLAQALHADPQATDPARILRPPDTFNHKRTPPTAVVCTRLVTDRFTAAQVVGDLPDTSHYTRPAPAPRRDGGLPPTALEGLARTVATAAQGGRNHALFWALCRGFEHVELGNVAESVMLDALSSAGVEAGLSGGEISASIGSARRHARTA